MNTNLKVFRKTHKILTFPFLIIDNGMKISTRFGKAEIGKYFTNDPVFNNDNPIYAKIATCSTSKAVIKMCFYRYVYSQLHLDFVRGLGKSLKWTEDVPLEFDHQVMHFEDEAGKKLKLSYEDVMDEEVKELEQSNTFSVDAINEGQLRLKFENDDHLIRMQVKTDISIPENSEMSFEILPNNELRKEGKFYIKTSFGSIAQYSWVHRGTLCVVVSEEVNLGGVNEKRT